MPPPRPPPKKKKGPPTLDPAVALSRKRGCLLGLAVGDALGTTMDGRRTIARPFPELNEGPHTEMTGGGPFSLKPGQVTGDTLLAIALVEVLTSGQPVDITTTLQSYLALLPHAFQLEGQTRDVMLSIKDDRIHVDFAAYQHWTKSSRKAASNGALVRAAPIAVRFPSDSKARTAAALADATLTHFDPRCQLTNVAFCAALAHALTSVDPPRPEKMVMAANKEISFCGAELGRALPDLTIEVRMAVDDVRMDFSEAQKPDPMLYGPDLHMHVAGGFVRVAFRLAFWELFHAPSFEAGLTDVVNRGGDADTNAGIAGALLGAVYGEEAIPQRWRETVLSALEFKPGPLANRYHPRELFKLIEPPPGEAEKQEAGPAQPAGPASKAAPKK
jgi:ADP-ribosyl-[dinitrogen reductase] hydrolase